MYSVDLNCDMGESFGAWTMGNDAALMDYVSSVNIACGFHAGDATTMRRTVETALVKGVAIGAHPGYPDLQGFGRRSMSLSANEIRDVVMYQVSAIKGVCEAFGGTLHHVKPHGAMYNFAARNTEAARAITEAVIRIDPELILFGLSGSDYISVAEGLGLRCSSEVFADRTYMSDGSLTPRTEPNALIHDTDQAIAQVLQMIKTKTVGASDGTEIPIRADTICIHGDGEHALEFARKIRQTLIEDGIEICPV